MLQDFEVFAEATCLSTQLVALRALLCRESRAFTLIDLGLLRSRPRGYPGQINVRQINVPVHLADVSTADTAALIDLVLEPRVVDRRGRTIVRSWVSMLTIHSEASPHMLDGR